MSYQRPSTAAIILHVLIATILLIIGVVVFLEQEILVLGKLTGGFYQLESPAHITMSMSFAIFAAFILLALVKSKTAMSICRWLFIASLVLFSLSLYI